MVCVLFQLNKSVNVDHIDSVERLAGHIFFTITDGSQWQVDEEYEEDFLEAMLYFEHDGSFYDFNEVVFMENVKDGVRLHTASNGIFTMEHDDPALTRILEWFEI